MTRTTKQIQSAHTAHYDRQTRAFRRAMTRATRHAAALDPATGGNECMVRNWGNAASRAAWERAWQNWRKLDAAYSARSASLYTELRTSWSAS